MKKPILLSLLTSFSLSACTTLGPDYRVAPAPEFELSWTEFAQQNSADNSLYKSDWWQTFNDPQLIQLIDEATRANFDIRDAYLRIGEARAAFRAESGRGFPEIAADVSSQRVRSSENGQIPLGSIPGASPETDIFSLGLGANWEIDFFGRVARAVEASGARAQMAAELYDGVLIAIQADTAAIYFEMRGLDGQIEAVQRGISSREQSVALTQKRADAGSSSQYDLSQAKSGLQQKQAELSPLSAARRQAVYRLAVLTGQPPAQMEGRFQSKPLEKLPDILVPVGIPSDLLFRRPDIRQAERTLAAETADIGVAEANKLPRFSLTGSVGLEATDFADLFSSDSVNWSFGGLFDFTLPFLGGERINQEAIIARSEAERAGLTYQKTILTALEDVEGSLTRYVELRKAVQELEASGIEQQKTTELARQRYDAGYSRLFEFLEQQERLTEIETRLAQRRAEVAGSVVQLYRGLGGSLKRRSHTAQVKLLDKVPDAN